MELTYAMGRGSTGADVALGLGAAAALDPILVPAKL